MIDIVLLAVLLSSSMGLINTTKELATDLQMYNLYYEKVSQYGFLEYVSGINKEPLFLAVGYIMKKYINLSWEVYVYVLTSVGYFVAQMAVFRYYGWNRKKYLQVIFGIGLIVFMPQVFAMSGHLLRQFLATGVLIYALVEYFQCKKINWFLFVIAGFIHVSSLLGLFLIMMFEVMKLYNKKIGIIKYFEVMLWMVFFAGVGYILFSFVPVLKIDYLIVKAVGISDVGFYRPDSIGLVSYLYIMAMAFSMLMVKKHLTDSYDGLIMVIFSYIVLLIAVTPVPQLQVRLNYYSYFFMPLVLPVFLKETFYNYAYIYLSVFMLLFIYFNYSIVYGDWKYLSLLKLLSMNYFSFF